MKKIIKGFIVLCLSLVMAVSSVVAVAAEEAVDTSKDESIITVASEDGSKAYQLVWKYKKSSEHLYKRRWNATLGAWYDPDWILVY